LRNTEDGILFNEHIAEDGAVVFAHACRLGAEPDVLRAETRRDHSRVPRLQLALNAALLGWWQYDPFHRVILVDSRLKEIFDFTADETPFEEFVERVHPDDLERVLADRDAALNPADPKPYAHEYRIRRRDGEVRWVGAHGLAYFEGAGHERRAVSFIGTVADITQLHELATNAGKYGALSTDKGRVDNLLGDRWRHLHYELGRTRWAARICAEAARVWYHSYGSDDGAQHEWHGRPCLCAIGRNLALDLPSSEPLGPNGDTQANMGHK
jgi:PAS domain S-box-containing protein